MLATLKRILAFWRPHRATVAGLLVTMLLSALFTVVLAVSVKLIIDAVVDDSAGTTSAGIIVVLAVGFLVSAMAGVARGYLAAKASAAILGDVRRGMFDHLQRLSMGFHTQSETGDLLARFSTDVAQLSDGVIRRPLIAANSLVALAFYLPVMATLELRLTIVAAVAVPTVAYLVNRYSPNADAALDEEKLHTAEILNEVSENLGAQATIRAFGLGTRSRERFGDRLGTLQRASQAAEFRVELLSVATKYGIALVQLIIVGWGAVLALRGSMAAGTLAAFVALLTEYTWEATVIGSDVLPQIRKAGAGIRRIDSLLSAHPLVSEPANPRPAPDISSGIRFEAVSFSYRGDGHRQLADVTLDIPANSHTAIVGSSGSGKSTLLNLVLRFYDPDAGRVLYDSIAGPDIALDDLRHRMGVVFQDTTIFKESLRENVRMGNPDLQEPDFQAAITGAGLAGLVDGLPNGADTLLGQGGHPISGGQRQRIGIARALARNPRVLLLDEMTSALDPITEAQVNDTVRTIREGRTVISVTHRLSTITDADLIVVLQGGKIEEQGSFADLRSAGGVFQTMWEKQQGFELSADGRNAAVAGSRLGLIPLFAQLGEAQLRALSGRLRSEWFPLDQDIFAAGAPGDRFYVIARGVVEVIDPSDAVVAHLEDGDFFGEMALLTGAARNATVRAVTPTTVLSLDRGQFETMLEESPDLAHTVRAVAAERAEANRLT